MTDDLQLQKARERVEELKGFYIHLLVYTFVNFGLFLIDALQGEGWWFYWATIGWGIGLAAHAVALFFSGRRVAAWEQRKIEQYLEETSSGTDRIST
jgi:hypothetical protein